MSPCIFYSTYRKCKDDTNNITSWLATTAKRCGYQPDLLLAEAATSGQQTAPKLKGRARKLAGDAAKKGTIK
jgi:hypothetical protein